MSFRATAATRKSPNLPGNALTVLNGEMGPMHTQLAVNEPGTGRAKWQAACLHRYHTIAAAALLICTRYLRYWRVCSCADNIPLIKAKMPITF
ncbi:hypothetical protein ACOMHN_048463 [Nucella lapillus]